MKKQKIVCLLTIFLFLVAALGACTQYHAQGAGAGAVLGGLAGALLDKKNPWRGGVIGAAIGGLAGATITDISMRANREAFKSNRPVEYRSDDGIKVVRAEPVGDYYAKGPLTKCKKVRERVWENDILVANNLNEVCESEEMRREY